MLMLLSFEFASRAALCVSYWDGLSIYPFFLALSLIDYHKPWSLALSLLARARHPSGSVGSLTACGVEHALLRVSVGLVLTLSSLLISHCHSLVSFLQLVEVKLLCVWC